MKKTLIALAAALLLCAPFLSAKTFTTKRGYELTNNELSVSYGFFSVPMYASLVSAVIIPAVSLGLATPGEINIVGDFSLEYHRRVHRNVMVGAIVDYEPLGLSVEATDFSTTDENDNHPYGAESTRVLTSFVSVMPSVKFPWFTFPNVSMYSKAAVGVAMSWNGPFSVTGKDENGNAEEQGSDSNNFQCSVAYQVSPICVDFGGRRLKGFAELGFGFQGAFITGVRYSF